MRSASALSRENTIKPLVITLVVVCALWVLGSLCSCARRGADESLDPSGRLAAHTQLGGVLPGVGDQVPAELPGLANVVAFSENIFSGGVPEGDAGFGTLASMGVMTVVSVDGGVPQIERARARGIRYIHLPIGYHGIDELRTLELVRAVRDASQLGAVYIHCHHGKHRSACAAAVVTTSLGLRSADQAVARMEVSGTAEDYQGLYECAQAAAPIGDVRLDRVPADFPEVSEPGSFVQGMVQLDIAAQHLSQIHRAGWKVPADHPDLVPAAQAGALADVYRSLLNIDPAHADALDFTKKLDEAHADAQRLEDMIVGGAPAASLGRQFELVTASCADCHSLYRNGR